MIDRGTWRGLPYVLADLGSGIVVLLLGPDTRAYRMSDAERRGLLLRLQEGETE